MYIMIHDMEGMKTTKGYAKFQSLKKEGRKMQDTYAKTWLVKS